MRNKYEEIDLTDYIRAKAKEIWQDNGWKKGQDLDYWLQAEKIIRNEVKEDLGVISNILHNRHRK
jgi:hypothetical protein